MTQAGRIGVWGASGSGKTTVVIDLVRTTKRLVIFDPEDEFTGKLRGVTRCTTLDQIKAGMRAKWNSFRLAYVPPPGKESAALSNLSRLVVFAQEPYRESTNPAHRLTLVADELNTAFPVHGGEARCPGFVEICARGRKRAIHTIGVSQRVTEVSTRFRGNLSEQIFLRAEELIDQKRAAEVLGLPLDTIRAMANFQLYHKEGPQVRAGATTKAGKIVYR